MTPLAKGVSLSPTTMMARSTPSPCIFSVMSWEQKGQGQGRQRRFWSGRHGVEDAVWEVGGMGVEKRWAVHAWAKGVWYRAENAV